MKRKILKLPALFFLSLSLLSAQEIDRAIPGREILEKITNTPGIIKTMVSREKGDDRTRWIEMHTDVHIVSAIPMDKLRRAILDFAQYPRIFRRNEKTAVIRENEAIYLDMDVGAEFLGIDFFVNYRVLVTEIRNTPEEFILDFSYISGDSSVQDVSGWWYLKKLPQTGDAEQQFYVRYYAYSKMANKYPFQRMIMSLFINSESRDLMNQFVKAAAML
jgi:hypothetical protein